MPLSSSSVDRRIPEALSTSRERNADRRYQLCGSDDHERRPGGRVPSLAMEYAKQGIRVNAVAPGVVDTPLHDDHPKDFLKTLQPMGQISDVKDIVDAIVYLTEAGQVTGEVLHVDGGAHVGKW
jgi:hypothetical protein